MEIPPLLLQSAGSLVAIFALYGLARWWKLGGTVVLANDAEARRAASEALDGFEANRVSISRGGCAALVRDDQGRIMVIKRHGNRFAGRLLGNRASVREAVDALVVDSGETSFGAVRLSLNDPGYWADAINRL